LRIIHALRTSVQNYFNYFTELEDRFKQRRGALLLLSTLDWALIETSNRMRKPTSVSVPSPARQCG
jgi:hypothetical protein